MLPEVEEILAELQKHIGMFLAWNAFRRETNRG